MQGELDEMEGTNENSASVISDLAAIGENVSEAQSTIERRRGEIQGYKNQIQNLLSHLKSH